MVTQFPSFSIIIATYERPKLLGRLLDDLRRQDDPPRFEVFVCDDGSSAQTRDELESVCSTKHVRLLKQSKKGFRIAAARNLGLRQAVNDIALFLDDDLRLPRTYLLAHARFHMNTTDPVALIGPRLFLPINLMEADTSTLSRARAQGDDRDVKYGLRFDSTCELTIGFPWKVFYTCNASVPLDAVRRVGLFDECFIGYGLEDAELAYRLFKAGARFFVSDSAPVYHEIEQQPSDPFKQAHLRQRADFRSYLANARRFLAKHDDAVVDRVLKQRTEAIARYQQTGDPADLNHPSRQKS